ncbi:MAG TPA: DUF928 domain-containing protein [Pyrinomonadaceae bacterium]|nr:DUF928 domain-containing protein [Pyrinomonadaceae bacterium]
MFSAPNVTCRSLMRFLPLLLIGLAGLATTAQAQKPTPSPSPMPQRRILPKPPTGSRGFEKYAGQDSSSRLIAGGATRGVNPRRPVAPLEGAAYESRPFFAWEIEPGSRTYHFTLYEGDVEKDAAARIVYQTDVTNLELSYPKDAPKLEPGKLYSWRVSTPTQNGKEDGPVARLMILTGPEAAEVRQALTTAGLSSPKTAVDRLDQARVFENFGVWYDAWRIVSELAQNPKDKDAQAYYDELLEKLEAKQEP